MGRARRLGGEDDLCRHPDEGPDGRGRCIAGKADGKAEGDRAEGQRDKALRGAERLTRLIDRSLARLISQATGVLSA